MREVRTRTPATLATIYLLVAIVLSGLIAWLHMQAVRGGSEEAARLPWLVVCIVGVLLGCIGLVRGLAHRSTGNMRVATLCFAFGILVLAVDAANLIAL